MDSFPLCLALGPVAVYLMLLGSINLSRRPFLVSGTRDAAALGLAISGFVIIGPVELFFPDAAAVRFGPYVWVLLVAFYALCLVLVLLLLRPRLIIYNISVDQLRPILADLAGRLDGDTRWAGDTMVLPGLGIQLHVDNLAAMRNVSLTSVGPNQSQQGWRRLEASLAAALSREDVGRNPRGLSLISAGMLIAVFLVLAIARNPQAVAQALFDMLRL
ncbi:MAG: hypothetical protein A2V70_07050 [Planctomycetes bacterium RBG_13_63_9]|nr:MAG: hypothetical protein A2V70_07050 [Planctomycetes bacterium RBG_13_63_9]